MNKKYLFFSCIIFIFNFFLCCVKVHASNEVEIIGVKLDIIFTEQKDIVKVICLGGVRNNNDITIKNVKVYIKIIDKYTKKTIYDMGDVNFPSISPNEVKGFQIQDIISNKDIELIRRNPRVSTNVTYNKISYLQIVDWIISKDIKKLNFWDIKFNKNIVDNEHIRTYETLNWLFKVPFNHPEYKEAIEKRNLIMYNYGVRLLETRNYHDAILQLSNVEYGTKYYYLAQRKIREFRFVAIYTRALEKAIKGNMISAIRQISKIPQRSEYFRISQIKIKEWKKILKSKRINWDQKNFVYGYLTPDKRKVLFMMGEQPEGEVSSIRNKQVLKTWWFSDYSHFTFDRNGKLINSVVYTENS